MANPDAEPTAAVSDAPAADEALWHAAVGKHADYYLPRFAKYEREKRTFPSWNWPALFIAFWWALYRKVWGGAIFFFFLPVLLEIPALLAAHLLAPGNDTAISVMNWVSVLVAWFLPPMMANGLYYRRVKAWANEARSKYPDTAAQIAYLSGRGGTSAGVAVAVGAFVVVALMGIIAAIALPAYQDYVTRSKVAEAIVTIEPLKVAVAESWSVNNKIPSELDLQAIRSAPGAAYIRDIHFNSENGTITVTFGALDNRLNGKSIEWVPSTSSTQPISWNCRTVDAVPRQLLPEICRH
jgi:Tfp pilus assembly major pilin PilA